MTTLTIFVVFKNIML